MEKEDVEDAVGVLACVILLAGLIGLIVLAGEGSAQRESERHRREAYIRTNCEVVGFYGRDGEYRTLRCGPNQTLYRESDIPNSVIELNNPVKEP